jgi:hypothetical protein
MEHDGEYERRGHDNDFLYDAQFIHVSVSPGYCFGLKWSSILTSPHLKNLPLPLFSKEGIKRISPFGKGGLRGI